MSTDWNWSKENIIAQLRAEAANSKREIARLRAELANTENARDEYLRMARLHGDGLVEAQAEIARLREALEGVLLDVHFMIERGVIPDVRNDMIYIAARAALGPSPPEGSTR
jgi:hypothetical protein